MRSIQVTRTQYKISDFISWQRNGELILSPEFQRRSVWKNGAKSYLMDTILRGYPIPIIFIRDQIDLNTYESKRVVVDGQQRIRTLIAYISPELLADFAPSDNFTILRTHHRDYAGKEFKDLPSKAKERILNYEFSVHVLPSDVPDEEVLQIFSRMNSTGTKLNAQELRNAEFFGEFKTATYESALMQLDRWKEWGIFSDAEVSRMDEVEKTSELFQFILEGVQTKNKPSLDKLYKDKDDEFPERSRVQQQFEHIMDLVDEESAIFREAPILTHKNVFFLLFVVIYKIAYSQGLRDSPPAKVPARVWRKLVRNSQRLSEEDELTRRLGQKDERQKFIAILEG